jgi:hypothetical protein
MNRARGIGVFVLAVAGCVTPAERVPLKPLGADAPPQPYLDLVNRARVQATAANEAFFVDSWRDLEEFAKGLEQTARFLPRGLEIPANHKDRIAAEAGSLEKEARQLQEAARAQNVKQTNEIMQRINLMVRQLRPDG